MPAIQVDNVSRIYRKYSEQHRFKTFKSAILKGDLFKSLKADEKVYALDQISFKVGKGTTFGVIGENGSGKSTLLKVVAGISKPTSGRVHVEGKISALIELGAGFHPEITGRENIYINGVMLGLTREEIDKKFDEIVKFAELEDFIDAPVKTYSSGMYMRLGFSIAINVNPDVLLVDEVLAVGDAAFVPRCLDRIDEFRRKKKTILFVSHDLITVERICDRVAWLKNGKMITMGDPKRVIDRYIQDVKSKKETEFEKEQQEEEAKGDLEEERRENRWGNREIEIKKVRIMDLHGKEKHVFSPSEGMAVEMNFSAENHIKDFVFGIGLFNSQGVCCYGTNTVLEGYKSESVRGTGRVLCQIKTLNLTNGTYYLDVAAHREDGLPYDYHRNLYSFMVSSKNRDSGIYRPQHNWEFSPAVKFKKAK
ncbi:MAG: ATP-binding cassette domain-containing protein [Candidatus Aminicenantes bacterium]|nr:ATP-binding cassette domain-containing protein [Candidatus Aminicenantes bacterium]